MVAASWITLKSCARSRLLTAFTLGALSLGLCTAALGQAIVVGAKDFTEQLLVAEMSVQLLRAHGFNAHKGTGFATTGVRKVARPITRELSSFDTARPHMRW